MNKQEFKIRTNKKKRVVTLWIDGNKFKSLPLSNEEFEEAEMNTYNDWKNQLKTNSGNLYIVK